MAAPCEARLMLAYDRITKVERELANERAARQDEEARLHKEVVDLCRSQQIRDIALDDVLQRAEAAEARELALREALRRDTNMLISELVAVRHMLADIINLAQVSTEDCGCCVKLPRSIIDDAAELIKDKKEE